MLGREATLVALDGRRFPIGERLVIGRARECDVVLTSNRVAKRHAVILRRLDDQFEVEDLLTTHGTLLNGALVEPAGLMRNRARLDVVGNFFNFELGPAVSHPRDELAQRVVDAPDEAALQVLIDELLEQGEPLGARLAEGAPPKLPFACEELVRSGALELRVVRGFVRGARFRSASFEPVRDALFALLRSDVTRLLEELTLAAWSPRFGLEGFGHSPLRTLRFGPFFDAEAADECRAQLSVARFPGLPRVEAPLLERYTRAWLEFGGGQRRELSPGRRERLGDCAVLREGAQWVVLREDRYRNLWVNGANRFSSELLPGDVVRSGTVEFTFRAA